MNLAHDDFSLRSMAQADAPRIAELLGDWEVVRWLATPPHPYRQADAREFLAALTTGTGASWRAAAIDIDGSLCGIVSIDPRRSGMNLGYWLGRSYWGRGIMTRAAASLTRDFFANSKETQLNSGYFSGNEASSAIQRRLGFQVSAEGLLLNRPQGRRLPHIETTLTRARFEAAHSGCTAQRPTP